MNVIVWYFVHRNRLIYEERITGNIKCEDRINPKTDRNRSEITDMKENHINEYKTRWKRSFGCDNWCHKQLCPKQAIIQFLFT